MCTDVVPVVRNDTNELWYTISYHLLPNFTRNKSTVCAGTPEKKKKRKKKKFEEGKERKIHRKKQKKRKERKRSKQALRAQAESLGDKVAVCWYSSGSNQYTA